MPAMPYSRNAATTTVSAAATRTATLSDEEPRQTSERPTHGHARPAVRRLHLHGRHRIRATEEQEAPPHRRMDRARRRAADPRRHRRRRVLRVEHVRGQDPRGHGLGRAQGLRGGPRQRRDAPSRSNPAITGQPISQALYDAGVTKTAGCVLRLPDRDRSEPDVPAGRLQAAEADDVRGRPRRAHGPGEPAGDHRADPRGLHRRRHARSGSPRAPASRSQDFQAAVADPSAYGVRRSGDRRGRRAAARGLAVPRDVHVRPRA